MSFVMTSFGSVFIALERIKLLSGWQVVRFLGIGILFLLDALPLMQFLRIYVAIEVVSFALNFFLLVGVVYKYEQKIAAT
jgi:hypothetical protein